jgi:hypothetical protein
VISVDDSILAISSLTMRDGYTSTQGSGTTYLFGLGGCLRATRSELFLKEVRVTNCRAHEWGGGVFLDRSSARFETVTIDGNRASRGGGVALGQSYLHGSTVLDVVHRLRILF